MKERSYEEIHGKEKADELRKIRSVSRKNKTYEELYGEERAKEINKKKSNSLKNIPLSERHKKNISNSLKGREITDEWRKKLSESHKGKKLSKSTRKKISKAKKGHIPWNKNLTKETDERIAKYAKNMEGRKHSEEHKRKIGNGNKGKVISEEHKQAIRQSKLGDKNPNWHDGSSFEPYGMEFNDILKEKIRKRNNYICQLCGKAQKELKKKLCIHHIDYNKDNNEEYNLISVCNRCNLKVNNKRQNWTEYFVRKMKTQEYMMQELTWEDIKEDCIEAYKFLKDKKIHKLIVILRGGIIPGVMLANMLDVDVGFRVTSENDVIIDEIVDYGITFKKWKKKHPKNLFVCLHFNKKHFKQNIKPDFYVREVEKFVRYPWEMK